MSIRRPTIVAILLATLAGCTSPKVETVRQFRAARSAGDDETAGTYLTDDPRTWYEERTGEGRHWVLGAGLYAEWDREFRSRSVPGPWTADGNTVSAVVQESNDYYRLIERPPGAYLHSYFLDEDGKIEGHMISAAPGWTRPESRFDEFEAWARANHPDEFDYLRPGGRLDPTGDRAVRTRRLANEWRRSVGLDPIE